MNIFVYGILARKESLFMVTRIRAPLIHAVIQDHCVERSPSGLPNLVAKTGSEAEGLVARDPPESYVKRLDWYYGPSYHREDQEAVASGRTIPVQTHVLKGRGYLGEGIIDSRWLSTVLHSGRIRRRTP